MNETKNGNVVLCGFWLTRNGHLASMPLDSYFRKMVSEAKDGGKLLVRARTQESISKSKNPDKAPTHYLEFVSPESVLAFNASKPATFEAGPI